MKNTKLDIMLSPLEQDVLKLLWPNKKLKVRQMYKMLYKKRDVALSSIAVILDRLYVKNIVDRSVETGRGGIRYIYFPKKNKQELELSIIDSTVNKLIQKFGSAAVSYFDERFSNKKGGK